MNSLTRHSFAVLLVALAASLTACGGSGGGSGNTAAPGTYTFESKFDVGESSVSYSGQVARQLLIAELNREINSGLQARIDGGTLNAGSSEQDVIAILESFYDGGTDALAGNELQTVPANSLQKTFGAVSLDKNLVGKTAGNDTSTDHRDWEGGDFVGWDVPEQAVDSPENLIRYWFARIAENTIQAASGVARQVDFSGSGSGVHLLTVYQTEDGLDLKQLVQKFLLGAVTFSQGTDDYFDDDAANKGLLTDNTSPDGDAPFSTLEHQFDEGFGYFGAARNFNDFSDDEIAGAGGRAEFANGYHDANGDGLIDLNSEFNFGHSTNAAKRDRGSVTGTDFTGDAFNALLAGRAIINDAVGRDLTAAELSEVQAQRDIVVATWENAIAATVVHYINDVISDMAEIGTVGYSYADHIKHWGEMKGFALGLQFNPRSPLLGDADTSGTEDFVEIHALFGQRPVLPGATEQALADYEADLLAARDLIELAYDFDPQDVANW